MEDQQAQNPQPAQPPVQQPVVYSSMPDKQGSNGSKKILMIAAIAVVILIVGLVLFLVTRSDTKKPTTSTQEFTVSSVAESAEIQVTKDSFSPATVRIKKDQSVTWVNTDDTVHQIASDPHPTHTIIPELFSDPLNKDESFSFSFDSIGTYTYHDEMNPLGMQGTIIVE